MRKWKVPLGRYAYAIAVLAIVVSGTIPIRAWAEGSLQGVVQPSGVPAVRLPEVALRAVAEREGVSIQDLELVNTATPKFPLVGKTVSAFKFLDKRNGKIYGFAVDGNGQVTDVEQLQGEERAAHAARYGRLDPALAERLATAPADEPIEVFIWLKEPPFEGPPKPDPKQSMTQAEVEAFFKQVDGRRAAAVEKVVAPVAERLRSLGHDVTTFQHSPVLHARLKPANIRQVAEWPQVDRVYEMGYSQPALDVARPTIGADAVNARGFTGSGIQAAQIEVGGRVATDNPYLAGITQDTTYVCDQPSSHSTAVAGIIRSTHASIRGISSGVSLWAGGSCTGNNAELANRSQAAVDWGARALNLSIQADTNLALGPLDRFYDDTVINRYRTVVAAAGNQGATTGNVTSPGLAYNVITVGNFDDNNTIAWDDSMRASSGWRDPLSTNADREKPEVAAPGTSITTTSTSSPWVNYTDSGTSFAAPMVTGTAALLMQRNSNLQYWPEAVKAILMATAVNNIEGDARLSEKDGAGGIVADRADDVARGVSGTWGAQGYSCTTASPLDVADMYVTAGTRLRAAIAWDNDINYTDYANRPSADLDLLIIDPAGNVVTRSTSWDNTYEIVDFTPTTTGTYKLRVSKFRCDLSPRWLGWAWRRGN